MTEIRRLLRVFLCHTSGDKPVVIELYERLVEDGVDAWLDIKKLLPGQDWEIEITKAVKISDVVIVCLSQKSITKEGFVQKEIRFALDAAGEKPDNTIFIIPARLENCEVPESIRKYHWVDLFSDDGYESLTKALQTRASNLGLEVKRRRKSVKPKIENHPIIVNNSQHILQNHRESSPSLLRRKTWHRKVYEFFIENWLITAFLSATPAWWFLFVETFGQNLGLQQNGIFSNVAFGILVFLFVFSFVFALFMALANKFDEKAKKTEQIILSTMLESVNSIQRTKLRRVRGAINFYYGKKISNPFEVTTQPLQQVENILTNLQDALSQITAIKRADISTSVIYKTDKDPLWRWLYTVNMESDLNLNELISNPQTTARQIIDGRADFIFYSDKRVGIKEKQYVSGWKDTAYGNIGSIICKNISLGTHQDSIQAILSISTYGLQICKTNDSNVIQKITSIILPAFEQRLQLELSFLYIKNVMIVPQKETNIDK